MSNRFFLFSLLLAAMLISAQYSACAQATGELRGTVITADGKPASAEVFAYLMHVTDGQAHPVARCSVKTDPDGVYTCPALSAGDYLVEARTPRTVATDLDTTHRTTPPATTAAKPQATEPALPDHLNAITFYPAARNLADAERVTVKPGQEATANILVQSTPAAILSGIIPGKPSLAAFFLSLPSPGFNLPTSAKFQYDPKTGKFQSEPIPYGEYLLSADWYAGRAEHHVLISVTISKARPNKLVVRENPQVTIAGTLRLQDGVTASLPSTVTVMCGPWEGKARYTSPVDQNGNFKFSGVRAGPCAFVPAATGQLYVQSIFSGGQELPLRQIVLGSTGQVNLDVRMSDKMGSIHGNVTTDGASSGDAGVIARSPDSGEIVRARINTDGTFVMPSVPAGSYDIYAWSDVSHAEYRNPAYLKRFANGSASVEVKPDAAAEVSLTENE